MIELHRIRQNKEELIERYKLRNFQASKYLNEIEDLDKTRRETQFNLDNKLSELNSISKEIGNLFKQGNKEKALELKDKTSQLKESTKELKEGLHNIETSLKEILLQLPNVPNVEVPSGNSADDNLIIKEHGEFPVLEKPALAHWELADRYKLIDFELGVKITGAGFPVYLGKGAILQRALINFFLDEAISNGYQEVIPPLLVNEQSAYGTGQLPDKEGQMYYVNEDNLYLIPTGEVPITNIFRDVVLNKSDFPIKKVGYTPCFRREAGSYGKDVRGLNRVHQFDKVEIVQITHPKESYSALTAMMNYVSSLLEKLELPYRVAKLCGGDLGFTSAITYDMEVFCVAQNKWLEVSSVSNFETFQSNRLKIKFKDDDNKSKFAHTLNGSALALPRILASILENNQSPEGIKIPKVLQKYTIFDRIS
jgi:seryl-tRNA synthetase